ncbi:MAG: hypothetical protein NVSMB18_17170 [Acetobacteraceae bacterium]
MLDVAPDLRLHITGEMPPLDPALDAVVERHWQDACRGRALFNGRIFCADRIAASRIDGHWTEYRRLLAQIADPALRPALGVRSLAVCGVLCCRDGVAIGRREANSVYEAGLWQLPPAGSVDAAAAEPGGASWQRALLAELSEEVGLAAASVTRLEPLCLVQHPSGVLDLGVRIETALSGQAVLEAHRQAGNREYDRLLIAPAADVSARVAELGGTLVRSAQVFLGRLALCGHVAVPP